MTAGIAPIFKHILYTTYMDFFHETPYVGTICRRNVSPISPPL